MLSPSPLTEQRYCGCLRSLPRLSGARFIMPSGLRLRAFCKSGVDVVLELDGAIQNSRFDHQVANQVEIRLERSEECVHHSIGRIRQGPAKEFGVLPVIIAADKLRRVLAVVNVILKPQSGSR